MFFVRLANNLPVNRRSSSCPYLPTPDGNNGLWHVLILVKVLGHPRCAVSACQNCQLTGSVELSYDESKRLVFGGSGARTTREKRPRLRLPSRARAVSTG